jgi:Ni,Fe-hydrogenase III component G
MNLDDTITRIETELGQELLSLDRKSDRRLYIDMTPVAVKEASRLMLGDIGARFQIATGVATREGIEVMYHWALDREGCVITLRTLLGYEQPEVDSIATLCPAAEWIEREMWELLGIQFRGHPDLRHLLLDDDWPEGNYPLRRDYQGGGGDREQGSLLQPDRGGEDGR